VMTTMSITGMLISAIEGVAPAINVPSALLTFYLVITALATVRAPGAGSRKLDVAAMVMALATGVACVALAFAAIAKGGREAGMAYPLVLFGVVALLAGEGDRRVIRAGGIQGAPRLLRHLWRMCFAMFIASIAFFAARDRVPDVISHPAFRAAGVLLPIVAIAYWQWRIRIRRTIRRGIPGVLGSQAAAVGKA
jgi:hypothetical protein